MKQFSGLVKISEKCSTFLPMEKKDEYMTSSGETFRIDHFAIEGGLVIKTLEGEHVASIGDYIIKGVAGEFYPCKPDIFAKTYDLAEE